jgi:tripartite-type tricarboxylate transporter receptor subunit TctC
LSVVAGQCLFTISDGPPVIPLVKGGKIRALAVTGSERSPELPDVPSMAEAGFPEVDTHLWSGFFVPAGTPAQSWPSSPQNSAKRSQIPGCRRA